MLYFTAEARDGISGANGNLCGTCCCVALSLRPGETNLVTVNYAPWSVPIGFPGIVPTFQFDIKLNDENCPTGPIDGFAPPQNTNYQAPNTPVNTPVNMSVATNLTPALNSFTYEILPLWGPYKGQVTQPGGNTSPNLLYTPNSGFQGWDVTWVKVTDAQGRSVVRSVVWSVGLTLGLPPREYTALVPFIDLTKVYTDQHFQTVRFAITMPLSCRACDEYRLTIKQPANDCDRNQFFHLSCYDIRCKSCF